MDDKKTHETKIINQSVKKIYAKVAIRKELLTKLDDYADKYGIDRQDALAKLLSKN